MTGYPYHHMAPCQIWARHNCLALCAINRSFFRFRIFYSLHFLVSVARSAWLLRCFNPFHSGNAVLTFPCEVGALWSVRNSTSTFYSATDCLGCGAVLCAFGGALVCFNRLINPVVCLVALLVQLSDSERGADTFQFPRACRGVAKRCLQVRFIKFKVS